MRVRMTIPNSTSTDPWEVVAYEARTLFDLRGVLGDEAYKHYTKAVQNATVESACLHTRILVDILLSKNSGKGDDIRLNQLLPGFSHVSVDQLGTAYGNSKTEASPCWTLNKMIAHPTLRRGTSYDYSDVLKKLLPLIEAVLQEIQNFHQGLLTKLPEPSRGMDSKALCQDKFLSLARGAVSPT